MTEIQKSVVGHSYFKPANLTRYPTSSQMLEIFCRECVPRQRAIEKKRWRLLSREEAGEKRLICRSCRTFLVTGTAAPLLPTIFARVLKGDPTTALWARSYSWVVASGLQHWINEESIPEDLWIYTRLVLLERLDQIRIPTHVTLEVEVRSGRTLETTTIRYLDSTGCVSGLILLMHTQGCERWAPLRQEPYPPQQLSPRELRMQDAGILFDPLASEKVAASLREVFGPFTLEWLFTVGLLYQERAVHVVVG
jgi:hypothetical protein